MTALRRCVTALAVLTAGAPNAVAQSVAGRVFVSAVRQTTASEALSVRLSGPTYGFEGAAGVGLASLALRYEQGTVRNDSAGLQRDAVEGEATLWIQPVRFAAVGVGPHVRSLVAEGSTDRTLMWEMRGRAQTQVVPGRLATYVEGWFVVGASVDVPEPFGSGGGVEGGLMLAAGHLPFAVRLRYRAERLALGDGTRSETTEHIALAVGLGRR